jgi:hypothetical protein
MEDRRLLDLCRAVLTAAEQLHEATRAALSALLAPGG